MAKKTTPPPEELQAKPAPEKSGQRAPSSTTRIFGSKVMSHGYTGVPNILLRSQAKLKLTPTQFNIIVQLLSYWYQPDQPPFPSKQELADRIGITTDTLRINMVKLEKLGLLQREQRTTAVGDYGSNTYDLDGLVQKLQRLEPKFTKERENRQAARELLEKPKRRRTNAPVGPGGTNGTA